MSLGSNGSFPMSVLPYIESHLASERGVLFPRSSLDPLSSAKLLILGTSVSIQSSRSDPFHSELQMVDVDGDFHLFYHIIMMRTLVPGGSVGANILGAEIPIPTR